MLNIFQEHLPNGLAGTPDLEIPDLLHLTLVLLAVVLLRVVVERTLGLGTVLDTVVQLVEQGLQVVTEAAGPVDGTTAGGGRASGVHPVHTVATDQRVQRLGSLLDGLVEGLGGGVAALPQNLVLRKEHTVDTTHQATTLTIQVGVDLLLEGGLVEVTGTNGNTHGNGLLLGLAGDVLVDGNGRVDTTTLTEEGTDGTAGALGGHEDDIDILGGLDLGEVLEDGGETVGEVESLALGDLGLERGPGLTLSSVGEQVHDDSTLLDGGVNIEQVLAGDPAILDGLLPRSTILPDTNNDIETLVTQVQTLAVTLRAITDQSKGVVLEELLELLTGPVLTLIDGLLGIGEGDLLQTTDGLLANAHTGDSSSSVGDSLCEGRTRESGGEDGARSSHTGATEGTGEGTRSHCE